MPVIPITNDGLNRSLKNPFRRPNERKVFRLNIECEDKHSLEIIVPKSITSFNYFLRGIRRPKPIVLYDDDTITVDNIKTKQPCELDSMLHRTILETAVKMALETYKQYN